MSDDTVTADVRPVLVSEAQLRRIHDLKGAAALATALYEETLNIVCLSVLGVHEVDRASVALTETAITVTVAPA